MTTPETISSSSGGGSSSSSSSIVVVTKTLPDEVTYDNEHRTPKISGKESRLDALDDFNHPRIRRGYILAALQQEQKKQEAERQQDIVTIEFIRPSSLSSSSSPEEEGQLTSLSLYQDTHSKGLLFFFETAWQKWCDLGEEGRDPMASLNSNNNNQNHGNDDQVAAIPPALIPGNVPLPRDPFQKPSKNVMGQIGYYCTDICTPVFDQLLTELQEDATIMEKSLEIVCSSSSSAAPIAVVYALPTHPGHHAARDSFGGYCYLNHAAMAAKKIQQRTQKRVAVLDIDYHCGNGTASILYNQNDNNNINILVVSIHCHPDYDYPFHSGFATTEEDDANNNNNVIHIPLLPGTTWKDQYEPALTKALDKIFGASSFQAQALIISMGLDTLQGDPVTLRRAGFALKPQDYKPMGIHIGTKLGEADADGDAGLPCLVIQEGGYKMDQLGQAAADVITGIAIGRRKK